MTTLPTRHIEYDRDCKDFAAYLDGEFVGSRDTYVQAAALLDA